MTMIRVICTDPYATDCSSGEESSRRTEKKSPKRVVYSIELNRSPAPTRPPKSPYKCVYWNKKRKIWTSEVRDPHTRARVYLGGFGTAEAAHEAYCKKKRELEERGKVDCSSDEYLGSKEEIGTRKLVEPMRNPVRATRSKVPAWHSVRKTEGSGGIEKKEAYNKEERRFEVSCSSSSENASLIIDEEGYLLGEFSQIDDLTISVEDA